MTEYKRENRIAEALSIRGWKQVDLVERTGIAKASINGWVKQNWQPKQKSLMKMAKVLDVSEMWLAGYDVPMERPTEQKKADEFITEIHQLKDNAQLRRLLTYASKLTPDQLGMLEKLAKELTTK